MASLLPNLHSGTFFYIFFKQNYIMLSTLLKLGLADVGWGEVSRQELHDPVVRLVNGLRGGVEGCFQLGRDLLFGGFQVAFLDGEEEGVRGAGRLFLRRGGGEVEGVGRYRLDHHVVVHGGTHQHTLLGVQGARAGRGVDQEVVNPAAVLEKLVLVGVVGVGSTCWVRVNGCEAQSMALVGMLPVCLVLFVRGPVCGVEGGIPVAPDEEGYIGAGGLRDGVLNVLVR